MNTIGCVGDNVVSVCVGTNWIIFFCYAAVKSGELYFYGLSAWEYGAL